ncbi:unnamed protein product [Auanema sp. JU1783]|nr:unnamed protein product [Auanema sp. JU1783]
MKVSLFFILLVLPMLASAVSKCYTYTNTQSHKADSKTQATCPANTNYCVKYTTNFRSNDGSSDQLFSRQCGSPMDCQRDGCFNINGGSVCCCSKNLCNTSTLTTGISSFIVLLTCFLFRS